jgi:hypothetical protein
MTQMGYGGSTNASTNNGSPTTVIVALQRIQRLFERVVDLGLRGAVGDPVRAGAITVGALRSTQTLVV